MYVDHLLFLFWAQEKKRIEFFKQRSIYGKFDIRKNSKSY